MKRINFLYFLIFFLGNSCSLNHKISKEAFRRLLRDSIASHAHIGISMYEPATGKYWYEYNSTKYFVPASNTKLFTLYAGLSYLGDSLPAFKILYHKDTVFILPTGDPTFLQPEFTQQKGFDYLRSIKQPVSFITSNWKENALGYGWSWDDFESPDMTERSAFPVYNNQVSWTQVKDSSGGAVVNLVFSEPGTNWKTTFRHDLNNPDFSVSRKREDNIYDISFGHEKTKTIRIPFVTGGIKSALELLKDTLNREFSLSEVAPGGNYTVVHSVPVDSLFTIMMHRSDNFFAEQTLLMASNEKLGYMNDAEMIKYLEAHDLKNIPQMPAWRDGSGLSRYNLFSPRDFIYILDKLKSKFGLERLKRILPTGGTGTLRSLYRKDSGYIFAKTGTLNNHVALSGYLETKQHKLLIFSILLNNFEGSPAPIRKSIEKFLSGIRQHY